MDRPSGSASPPSELPQRLQGLGMLVGVKYHPFHVRLPIPFVYARHAATQILIVQYIGEQLNEPVRLRSSFSTML